MKGSGGSSPRQPDREWRRGDGDEEQRRRARGIGNAGSMRHDAPRQSLAVDEQPESDERAAAVIDGQPARRRVACLVALPSRCLSGCSVTLDRRDVGSRSVHNQIRAADRECSANQKKRNDRRRIGVCNRSAENAEQKRRPDGEKRDHDLLCGLEEDLLPQRAEH
jgi:hypothetical protein